MRKADQGSAEEAGCIFYLHMGTLTLQIYGARTGSFQLPA